MTSLPVGSSVDGSGGSPSAFGSVGFISLRRLRLNSTAHDGTVTVESRERVERTSVLRLSAVFLIKASAGRNQG